MRKMLGLMIVCLGVVLAGCASNSIDPVTTDPTHFYEEVREDFLIDAEVISFPGGGTVTVYEATPRTLTQEQINNFLAANGDAMVGHDGLGMIVLAMATIPHGTGYLTDRESGFEYYAIKRIGFPAYATAKVMSAGLSAFFAMVTASGIFLSGLYLTGAGHTVPGGGEYLNGAYYDLVILVGPWFYYFARMMVSGLTAALASVFALYITTLIPNAYVALLSPLIGYYAYDSIILGVVSSLTNRAPYLRLFGIQNIMTFLVSQHNVGFSLLWAVVFLLTMTVLCGRGFVLQLRKEQGL